MSLLPSESVNGSSGSFLPNESESDEANKWVESRQTSIRSSN